GDHQRTPAVVCFFELFCCFRCLHVLQAGSNSANGTAVLWCIEDGEFLYEAWYEYLPASSVVYSGISVSAGLVVTVTATKTSTTSGVTTLTSGRETVFHTFSRETQACPVQALSVLSRTSPPATHWFHLLTLDLLTSPEQAHSSTEQLLHLAAGLGLLLTWRLQEEISSPEQQSLAAW
ncbi:hypothetical protein V8C42DRAFT_318695, partial [Trichoderma barbatum]